ncbi:MAG: FAD-binding protein [Actinomycetota bacterium]|nr:FAD-binding protein [Actinomycetota bacterium]
MGRLKINQEKVNKQTAEKLIDICPFGSISLKNGQLEIDSGCKMCKICVKKGPKGVIEFIEDKKPTVDKSQWKDITVYVDHIDGQIHPVTYELIGKAKELAQKVGYKVNCLFIGHHITDQASQLLEYGVNQVFVYDDQHLKDFRIEPYTLAFEHHIKQQRPSVILVGATTIGRSLAPRVAGRFRTGLTADCTVLDIKQNTDLIQIRPAFGGNIMAKIVTPNSRPQFATVRYKVMDAAPRCGDQGGKITHIDISKLNFKSGIEVLNITEKELEENISDADTIIAVGKAVKDNKQMDLIKELAQLLGAQIAGTRPLIESGLIEPQKQIGLSGRTVKPKLIITLGISGAVQFIAGMSGSEHIFAVNKDPQAPIFNVANYSIVGDIFEVVPLLIAEIKKHKGTDVKECVGVR